MADVNPNNGVTGTLIGRGIAIVQYLDHDDAVTIIRNTFASEHLNEYEMYCVYCAALTCIAIDKKFPYKQR